MPARGILSITVVTAVLVREPSSAAAEAGAF
jgi:hypothetical protein